MDNVTPLYFEENLGQYEQGILYSLSDDAFFTLFYQDEIYVGLPDKGETADPPLSLPYFLVKLQPFSDSKLVANDEISGHKHFIINPAIKRGFAILPLYQKLTYQNIYNEIDLEFYLKESQLHYTFLVKPGASVSSIQLSLQGPINCQLDQLGNLSLQFTSMTLPLPHPKGFQRIHKRIYPVDIHYAFQEDSTICFKTSPYNKNYPLVIKFL